MIRTYKDGRVRRVPVRKRKEPLAVSFAQKFERRGDDECWLWIGSILKSGYGSLSINGKTCRAHTVAFELAKGPVPAGFEVCHTCDTPRCVNPAHLFAGTHAQNMRDMKVKGRVKATRGEQHYHSKLNAGAVRYIRFLWMFTPMTASRIGAFFGIKKNTVMHVINDSWRHIK